MTTYKLKEKITKNLQKNRFANFMENIIGSNFKRFFIAPMYFPESSDFIKNIIEIRKNDSLWNEKFLPINQDEAYEKLRKLLLPLSTESTLLCLLPNFSIMDGMAISDFPVIEINGEGVKYFNEEIFHKFDFLHVFLCATPDLRRGIFFDVCAGDPEISGSDAPIYNFYVWGND